MEHPEHTTWIEGNLANVIADSLPWPAHAVARHVRPNARRTGWTTKSRKRV